MKIGQIKIACYVVALVLVVLGAQDVLEYVQSQKSDRGERVQDSITEALGNVVIVPPQRTGIVSYEDVKRGYHRLNWTGEPPPDKPKGGGDVPAEKPKKKLADVLVVLLLRIDTDAPDRSMASIAYKSTAGVPNNVLREGQDLQPGDTLAAPLQWAKVAGISLEGIEFEFDEEGRENEVVGPASLEGSEIVFVGPDGVRRPAPASSAIRQAPGLTQRVRDETYERRNGQFVIGTVDSQRIAENYPTILSSEVRHRRHRDPKTGRFDGIEIQSVTPGGVASRHGAQSGDVIKSINGHPVTSVAEAVAFVREHKDEYSTWEVEIENQGNTRTVTYESPDSE